MSEEVEKEKPEDTSEKEAQQELIVRQAKFVALRVSMSPLSRLASAVIVGENILALFEIGKPVNFVAAPPDKQTLVGLPVIRVPEKDRLEFIIPVP
jgi:hypothetical protein